MSELREKIDRAVEAIRAKTKFAAPTGIILGTGLGGIALVVAAYAPFWHGIETLGIGLREGLYTASLPAFFFVLLSGPLGEGTAAQLISLAAAGLTGLFALWRAARAWQERSWWSFPQAALHMLAFYLLLTCLWFQQWYAVWLVGLAALLSSGLLLAPFFQAQLKNLR